MGRLGSAGSKETRSSYVPEIPVDIADCCSSPQNDVHKYAGELFGIPLGQTPATKAGVGALLPGPPENPDIAPPTGVENFRYAWNRPPTNLYNQAAATNFANAMVMSPRFPYVRAQFLELRATFLRYAGRTLKKAWEDKWLHPPNPTAVFSYRQGENARSRQYRVRSPVLSIWSFSHYRLLSYSTRAVASLV